MAEDAPKLHRVRTGETSYLKLNDADLKAWKEAGNVEYGTEPDAEAKAVDAPVENKAKSAPAEKKAK